MMLAAAGASTPLPDLLHDMYTTSFRRFASLRLAEASYSCIGARKPAAFVLARLSTPPGETSIAVTRTGHSPCQIRAPDHAKNFNCDLMRDALLGCSRRAQATSATLAAIVGRIACSTLHLSKHGSRQQRLLPVFPARMVQHCSA